MSTRIERLNSEFRKYIYELLTQKVKDPRITEIFTILSVECDKELSSAKVYVSIFSTDNERAAKTFLAMQDSQAFLRRQIGKLMHIRTVPNFVFVLDKTMAHSQRINEILNELQQETKTESDS